MFLMIIGFIICVFVSVFVVEKVGRKCDSLCGSLSGVAIAIVGFVIAMSGLMAPIHGYEEPIVFEEYALEEITEETGIYVIQSNGGTTVTCKHILNENGDSISEEKYFAYDEECRIVTGETSKPIMKKTLKKAKRSPLTFALG